MRLASTTPFVYLFIHLLCWYLLRPCHVQGSVRDTSDTAVNRQTSTLPPWLRQVVVPRTSQLRSCHLLVVPLVPDATLSHVTGIICLKPHSYPMR